MGKYCGDDQKGLWGQLLGRSKSDANVRAGEKNRVFKIVPRKKYKVETLRVIFRRS